MAGVGNWAWKSGLGLKVVEWRAAMRGASAERVAVRARGMEGVGRGGCDRGDVSSLAIFE